jgi:Asp-tRNA(Asn)/Glu-tRNA(Gln) amidotransferase A subunit family amidase
MARQSADSALYAEQKEINDHCRAIVADLVEPELPPEYVEAMAAYHAQVEEINSQASFRFEKARAFTSRIKAQIDADLQAKVADVYAQVENRKAEIIAEFGEKAAAVVDNIAKLTAEIKEAVIAEGKSVKGKAYQAVYVKGRVTWITDMLDGMIVAFPALAKARKEGTPSVTLRRIT